MPLEAPVTISPTAEKVAFHMILGSFLARRIAKHDAAASRIRATVAVRRGPRPNPHGSG